ncbi:MAG: hypothetical protein ACK452_14310 [Bacteroidota bacterium]|jgi:hypothetical protein
MKKNVFLILISAFIIMFGINAGIIEKDALHGKKYDTNATEYKDGSPKQNAKSFPYELEFKNGKLYYNLAADTKGGGFDQWIKYEIKKDSTYTDEDIEKRYFEVKASAEDDDGKIITITATIDETSIEGSLKVVRREKLMKHFEFTGEEKAKKKK